MSAVNIIVDDHTRVLIVKLPKFHPSHSFFPITSVTLDILEALDYKHHDIVVKGHARQGFITFYIFDDNRSNFPKKDEIAGLKLKSKIVYNQIYMTHIPEQINIKVNVNNRERLRIAATNVGLLTEEEINKVITQTPLISDLWKIVLSYLPKYLPIALPIDEEVFKVVANETKLTMQV